MYQDHPKFYGKYRGIVEDALDPKKLGRLIVYCPVIHGSEDDGSHASTGWAFPLNVKPISYIPKKGEFVLVEFEDGDPEKALWSPSPFIYASNVSDAPEHVQGKYSQPDASGRPSSSFPDSSFTSDYAETQTWKVGESFIELDGRESNQRIQIYHKSGTRIEIKDDGTVEIFTRGNEVKHINGSEKKTVVGNSTELIKGASSRTVKKSSTTTYEKDYEHIVLGNQTYRYSKNLTEIARGKIIQVSGAYKESIGGDKGVIIQGKESSLIVENLQYIIMNSSAQSPGVSFNPLTKHLSINMKGPVGIPLADLEVDTLGFVLNHIVRIALTTPICQLGLGVIPENIPRGISLLTWLATHVHTATAIASPTTPPVVPPPLTLLSATSYTMS